MKPETRVIHMRDLSELIREVSRLRRRVTIEVKHRLACQMIAADAGEGEPPLCQCEEVEVVIT